MREKGKELMNGWTDGWVDGELWPGECSVQYFQSKIYILIFLISP